MNLSDDARAVVTSGVRSGGTDTLLAAPWDIPSLRARASSQTRARGRRNALDQRCDAQYSDLVDVPFRAARLQSVRGDHGARWTHSDLRR